MLGPLGLTEILFILALALLVFGPRRLPEIGRALGRGLGELRRASEDLKRSINTDLTIDEPPQPTPRRPPAATDLPAPPAARTTPPGTTPLGTTPQPPSAAEPHAPTDGPRDQGAGRDEPVGDRTAASSADRATAAEGGADSGADGETGVGTG